MSTGPQISGCGDRAEFAERVRAEVEQATTDLDSLRYLLDIMSDFASNDQRARFLLSSNWMRDHAPDIHRRFVENTPGVLSELRLASQD